MTYRFSSIAACFKLNIIFISEPNIPSVSFADSSPCNKGSLYAKIYFYRKAPKAQTRGRLVVKRSEKNRAAEPRMFFERERRRDLTRKRGVVSVCCERKRAKHTGHTTPARLV